MSFVANLLVGFVALSHIGFLVLEMFLWAKPVGQKIFGTDPQFASATAALASNQGLYNGFLAAGLIWSLLHPQAEFSYQLKIFFILCVIVAGVFGAMTASRTILFVQALPAALALAFVWLAR